MADSDTKRAEKLIALRDAEYSKQANFRQLWQDTADWILPMFGRIQTEVVAGERFGETLHDVTARGSARKMASGLSSEIIPPGQEFFDFKSADRGLRDDGQSQEYLAQITEDVHEIMFDSNFIQEFDAAVLSLVTFGISDTYPKWAANEGLRYMTYPIGSYQVRENSDGIIDTKIITLRRTARQLFHRYGLNIGEKVRKGELTQAVVISAPSLDPGVKRGAEALRAQTSRTSRAISKDSWRHYSAVADSAGSHCHQSATVFVDIEGQP